MDNDVRVQEGLRFIQLSLSGLACSVSIGEGITKMEPGSQQGLQLVVDDIEAARDELARRAVEVSEVQDFPTGRRRRGRRGRPGSIDDPAAVPASRTRAEKNVEWSIDARSSSIWTQRREGAHEERGAWRMSGPGRARGSAR